MKTNPLNSRRHRAGFTLVELLTVIAIIAILAGMLLPVLSRVRIAAQKKQALIEEQGIVTAIQKYDSDYGRFPVSAAVQAVASANAGNAALQNGDFTYGGTGHDAVGNLTWTVGTLVGGSPINNSEVIAILMNFTTYPGTSTPTSNTNGQKNPQQTIYLTAKMSGDTKSSGVGTDLVYRDPWGNPYIITIDLNYDELCEDSFYESAMVSSNGFAGLFKASDGNYAYRGKVMVWSSGPDGKIDTTVNAISGANKDNVVSWQ